MPIYCVDQYRCYTEGTLINSDTLVCDSAIARDFKKIPMYLFIEDKADQRVRRHITKYLGERYY